MASEPEDSKDYSYHIFLFPFKWDYKATDASIENIPFEERTKIDFFDKSLDKNRWVANDFAIQKGIDYNEWIYFYPFVRQAIYTTNEQKEGLIKQYSFRLKDNGIYSIHTKKGNHYDLDLERITLNCYDTGVAILTYHLKNSTYAEKEDILIINDFGRRIYPSFLDANSFDISHAKSSFLADKIELNYDKDNPITESEDFSHYDNPDSIKQNPIYLPNHVGKLLGSNFKTTNIHKGDILVDPIIDDRMYVICWYGNNNESNRLKEWNDSDKTYKYELDDFWYQFIFIDNGGATCTGRKMKQNLITQSTNTRWIEDSEKTKYGTLYGITRYSFLMLTNEESFAKNILPNHLKTMYYQMVMLNLAQRASILRFSSEITYVSGLDDDVIVESVKQLYKKYLRFLNKIHFREVTAQEQGIELYDKLQEMMKIERDVQNMDRELEELHNYAVLIENVQNQKEKKAQEKALNRLTVLGAALLLPTFIAGFYGMNIFDGNIMEYNRFGLVLTTISFIAIPILIFLIFNGSDDFSFKDTGKSIISWFSASKTRVVSSIFAVLITSALLIYPLCKSKTEDSRIPEENQKAEVVGDSLNIYLLEKNENMTQKINFLESQVDSLKTPTAFTTDTSKNEQPNN